MAEKKRSTKKIEPTEALISDLCMWISNGNTLREWCRKEGNPSRMTVYKWMNNDDEILERIARARDIGYDEISEQALEYADKPLIATVVEEGDNDGKPYIKTKTYDNVARSKEMIYARLQLLAKWSPRYREKQAVELTGADGKDLNMNDSDLAIKMAAILKSAQERKEKEESK